MGQHKRPNDINKRPTSRAQKPSVSYVSFGRIPYKPTQSLASNIKSPRANNKESR